VYIPGDEIFVNIIMTGYAVYTGRLLGGTVGDIFEGIGFIRHVTIRAGKPFVYGSCKTVGRNIKLQASTPVCEGLYLFITVTVQTVAVLPTERSAHHKEKETNQANQEGSYRCI
jgi:hypothetical protein